jgi:hypothetical protein
MCFEGFQYFHGHGPNSPYYKGGLNLLIIIEYKLIKWVKLVWQPNCVPQPKNKVNELFVSFGGYIQGMVFRVSFLAHVTQYPLIEPLKITCYGPIWMDINSHKMWSCSAWNLFRINQNLRTHFFLHLAFLLSISHFLTYYQILVS